MAAVVVSVIGAEPLMTLVRDKIKEALGEYTLKNLGPSTMSISSANGEELSLPLGPLSTATTLVADAEEPVNAAV